MWISLDKRLCKLRFINTCHSFSRADCFTLKFRLVKYLLFFLKGLKFGLVLGIHKGLKLGLVKSLLNILIGPKFGLV